MLVVDEPVQVHQAMRPLVRKPRCLQLGPEQQLSVGRDDWRLPKELQHPPAPD